MDAAVAAMANAVLGKTVSFDALRTMKQKELTKLYPNAGRTLLVEAREKALASLPPGSFRNRSNKIATKNK